MSREWDFGFSLEDEDFVVPLKKEQIDEKEDKLTKLASQYMRERDDLELNLKATVALILPLLNNLMASPEKPTIYWPNRVEKVAEFKEKILSTARLNEDV